MRESLSAAERDNSGRAARQYQVASLPPHDPSAYHCHRHPGLSYLARFDSGRITVQHGHVGELADFDGASAGLLERGHKDYLYLLRHYAGGEGLPELDYVPEHLE